MKEQDRTPTEYEYKNLKKKEFMVLMARSSDLAGARIELKDLQQRLDRMARERFEMKDKINNMAIEINKLQIERVADLKAAKYFVEIGNSGGTHNEKRHLVERSIHMLEGKEQDLLEGLGKIANSYDQDGLPF
jgi:hypothetical protein